VPGMIAPTFNLSKEDCASRSFISELICVKPRKGRLLLTFPPSVITPPLSGVVG